MKLIIIYIITDIIKIEEFSKTTLTDLIEENQHPEYYRIFKNKVSKLKFLDSYLKQLYIVIDFYKKQLEKN